MVDRPAPFPWDIVQDGVGYMLGRREDQTLEYSEAVIEHFLAEQTREYFASEKGIGLIATAAKPDVTVEQDYYEEVDDRVPGQTIAPPYANEGTLVTTSASDPGKVFIKFGASWYKLAGDRYVRVWNGTQWALSKDLGASAFAMNAVVFQGTTGVAILYVACTGANYWLFDGTTWTQSSVGRAIDFCVIGNDLWKATDVNHVIKNQVGAAAGASDSAGDWAGDVAIGDRGISINRIVGFQDRLMIGKEDIFATITKDVTAVDQEIMRVPRDSSNFLGLYAWTNYNVLIIPTVRAVYIMDADFNIRPIGFDRYLTNDSPIPYCGTAFVGDENQLWAGFATLPREGVSDKYLCVWQPGPDAWKVVLRVASSGSADIIYGMGISDTHGNNRRLWFGDYTKNHYIILPRNTINPYLDANCQYDGGTLRYKYFPRDFFGDLSHLKAWKGVRPVIEFTASGQTVTIEYRTLSTSGWTTLATITSDAQGLGLYTSRTEFPATVNSMYIEVRYGINAGSSPPKTTTPIIRSHALIGAILTNVKRRFKYTCQAGQVVDRSGNVNDDRTARGDVENLYGDVGASVPLMTPLGLSYNVLVKDAAPRPIAFTDDDRAVSALYLIDVMAEER